MFNKNPSPIAENFLALSPDARWKYLTTLSDAEHVSLMHECMRLDRHLEYQNACHARDVLHDSVTISHPHWGERLRHLDMFDQARRANQIHPDVLPSLPAAPAFCHGSEMDQILAFAAMSDVERRALQMTMMAANASMTYNRAADGFDTLTNPHAALLAKKNDLIAHLKRYASDPVAELAKVVRR